MRSIRSRGSGQLPVLLLEAGLLTIGIVLVAATGLLLIGRGAGARSRRLGERQAIPLPGSVRSERHAQIGNAAAR